LVFNNLKIFNGWPILYWCQFLSAAIVSSLFWITHLLAKWIMNGLEWNFVDSFCQDRNLLLPFCIFAIWFQIISINLNWILKLLSASINGWRGMLGFLKTSSLQDNCYGIGNFPFFFVVSCCRCS
jgi:hypothetical protein